MNSMMTIPFCSRAGIEALTGHLLQTQIAHAVRTVPFYEDLFAARGLRSDDIRNVADLQELPVITKDLVRQKYNTFFSSAFSVCPSFKGHTSGTTGEPFTIHFDTFSWMRKKYFSKVRARHQCGASMRDRFAVIDCESVEKMRTKDRAMARCRALLPQMYISIFEEPDVLFDRLKHFAPQWIYSMPSLLVQCVDTMLRRKTARLMPALRGIFTSSEYLTLSTRRSLETFFGAPIYDTYGSTEFKEIAWQCPERVGYHINEDEVICEVLVDGWPAHPGEEGEVVITDLRNRRMPLIRYALQDRGMLCAEPCRCGRRLMCMKPASGRSSDHIDLPNGEKILPYAFTTELEHIIGLYHYQIVQNAPASIMVHFRCSPEDRERVSRELTARCRRITKETLAVTTEHCTKIITRNGRKQRVVVNELER